MRADRFDAAALGAGLLLLAYTAARAARLAFTHDEALTWLYHVRAPLGQTLTFHGLLPTNNHLLNTLLARVTGALFGPSEWALRLPNLGAHAAFLWYSWRLLRRFVAPWTALAAFVALAGQPFVLDFFSLCRGYGLSMAFLMAGLESLCDADARREPRGFALVALGCLAAFSLVFAYAGALVAVLAARRRLRPASLAVTAGLAAIVTPALVHLRRELDFGGPDGFWRDTAGSLVRCVAYDRPVDGRLLAAGVALGLLAAWPRSSDERRAPWWFLLVVVAVSALAQDAAHLTVGTRFVTDRMAVFYVPLTILAALFACARAPRLQRGLAAAAAALTLIHLVPSLNLRSTYLWAYDADDRQVLADLPARPLRLGVTWIFSPSLEYYRLSRGLPWLAPVVRGSAFGDYDYSYVTPEEREQAARRGLLLVKEYPSRNALYRRPP